MLSHFRRRSLFSPCLVLRIPRIPTRSLNTLPTLIPAHAEPWNPTQHRGLRPPPSLAESDRLLRDQRKARRTRLRYSADLISFTGPKLVYKNLPHIRKLDELLRLVESGKGKGRGEEIWHAYHAATKRSTGLKSALTERAWAILVNLKRPKSDHVHRPIGMDWSEAKETSPKHPRIELLESMILDGKVRDALKEWEHDHYKDDSPSRIDFVPSHLEIGVKLYALTGNADRARDIMEELFRLYPRWHPTVMMHVFRVHTDTNTEEHHEEAWKIYQRMRKLLGNRVTLQDFDSWLIGFLECQHLLYARSVFRDMVQTNALKVASSTQEDINKTLRRLYLLSRLGTDILRITDIYLMAISVLPAPYHSHIYLNWMAAAVKFRAPKQLSYILQMMIKRNQQPTTTHYNLLLRALFRTDDLPSINKAEDLGWRMIEEARKQGPQTSDRPLISVAIADAMNRMQEIESEPVVSNKARQIPSADGATFGLIMQHHADLDQWEHVDYLVRRLDKSEVTPNQQLMNVLISNHTRKGQFDKAWTTYTNLTTTTKDTPGLFPNGTTVRYVWRNLQLALGDDVGQRTSLLPSPRSLLGETVTWWKRCHRREDAEQFLTGLAALDKTAIIHMMLHCFSYTKDFAGSLVALHVLTQYFNIYPLDDTRKILQRQAAWVDDDDHTQGRVSLATNSKRNMSKMESICEILAEQRWQRMGYTSDDERIVDIDPIVLQEAELNHLSEFIRVIMKRSHRPETIESMIAQVKEEVGVPNMATGDLDAFSVA